MEALDKIDDSAVYELKYCFEEITKDMEEETLHSMMYGVVEGSNIDWKLLINNLLGFCKSSGGKYSSYISQLQEVIDHWPSDVK